MSKKEELFNDNEQDTDNNTGMTPDEEDSQQKQQQSNSGFTPNPPNPYIAQQTREFQQKVGGFKKPALPYNDQPLYTTNQLIAVKCAYEEKVAIAAGVGLGAGLVLGALFYKFFIAGGASTAATIHELAEDAMEMVD